MKVNKQLPGFNKIEPYRGLSCVPGNLLAQFLGGDGGVSLPTYPVPKRKTMKKTIRDSLLDAEMNVRYWKRLTQRYSRRDKVMKIFLAILSSGTVAGWGLWQEIPLLWKSLSAIAALIAIAMPFLNYQKVIEVTSDLSGKWWELRNEYEQHWISFKNNENPDEIKKRHSLTKQKETPLVKKEANIPEDNKLLLKCFNEVERQYGLS